MTNLFIDTCNSNLTIALTEDNNILYFYNEQVKTELSSKIFPVMQEAFVNAKLDPKDIDNIFVTNGPGSFTGIRMGVTVAKTYAWALNIKIIPVSSLELMATTKVDKEYFVPIIDARRGYVYAGIYNEHLDIIMEDTYISIDELKKQLKDKSYKFISYDEFDLLDTVKPKINILKIIDKHKKDKSVNPHLVNPNYLKLTEAEMNLKNND